MRRFIAVTFGLGWAFQLAYPTSYFWLAAAMWAPALGALAEGFRPPPPALTAGRGVSYWKSVWPVVLWVALLVTSTLPFQPLWPQAAPSHLMYLLTAPIMPAAVAFVGAFGEEYGWRGYLLPSLAQRFGFFKASLIVGVVWGFWHAPAILLGYEYGWFWRVEGVLLFILPAILLSLLHTAVYLQYGVWGAALLHGAVNSWAPMYFLLYPQLLDERWLWGPVGLQGVATLIPVAAVVWEMYARGVVYERTPKMP